MSILTACQAVVRETGIGAVPATIISNTDPTAVQLNALAERSAKFLMQRNWQRIIFEHTITTTASTATYALPTLWARYISATAWDATRYMPMRGQMNPMAWQALKRGQAALNTTQRNFRVIQNVVSIFPVPTVSNETLIIEYAVKNPWLDSTGVTGKVLATADSDITIFPDFLLDLELKWRWLQAKGLDYAEAKNEAEEQTALAFAQDTPAPIIDYGQCSPGLPVNVTPQIPY